MSAASTGFGRTGFFGKIPSRGDFVRSGLSASFVAVWDRWVAGVLVGSRDILGPEWLPAWLEAPVWCFALPGGMAGPDTAVGLFMPSVDSAGRFFPLCLVRLAPGADALPLAAASTGFLAAAEAAGRAALEQNLAPEVLAADLARDEQEPARSVRLPPGLEDTRLGQGIWWTEGSPRVSAGGFALGVLPGPRRFAAMLDERVAATRLEAQQ